MFKFINVPQTEKNTGFIVGIPTLNRYDLLEKCIDSVWGSSIVPNRVIIIDNGGTLNKQFEKTSIVTPEKNLGVAGSWNLLLKLAAPKPIVLLNDDIVLGPQTLEKLFSDPAPISCIDLGKYSWSCFRINQTCWEAVGPFDEQFYPAYYEDDDYKYRLSRLGIAMSKISDPDLQHLGNATKANLTGLASQQFIKDFAASFAYYEEKWGGPPGQEKHDL